jgi:hypothetical protein
MLDSVLYETHAHLRLLRPGERLSNAGDVGSVWEIRVGALVLEQPGPVASSVVQLLLPGDLVGAETLCGECYVYGVSALLPTTIGRVVCADDLAIELAVQRAFLQQQVRQVDMLRLRSGSVHERLSYLLKLLSEHRAKPGQWERKNLPPLTVLASLVAAKVDTVCREMPALLGTAHKQTTQQGPKLHVGAVQFAGA